MKRNLCLLMTLLLLCLCACGTEITAQARPESGSESGAATGGSAGAEQPAAPAARGSYRRVDITEDNWRDYFELMEIPLYVVSGGGEVIALVDQNYCVVPKQGYQELLRPDGSYSVSFAFSFDLYVETLDVDTNTRSYRHTDDRLFAVEATKTAVYDRTALPASAYGEDQSLYAGYGNAFFTGYAMLHTGDMLGDHRAWSGFYIDLSQVRLQSVSGYLELAG